MNNRFIYFNCQLNLRIIQLEENESITGLDSVKVMTSQRLPTHRKGSNAKVNKCESTIEDITVDSVRNESVSVPDQLCECSKHTKC